MSVVDALLDNAYQDTQLLIVNDEKGDDFKIPRDVDFVFYTTDKQKADTVAGFVSDNNYGSAFISTQGDNYVVRVVVNMPSTQHVICCTSGLMACIAQLFGVEYDGWGCVLQTT
ncbi:ribonuclease E inhibitor RraB [Marinimicrobium agarilyticum]|uniref:ribonuclease E inhibitor RraB n=1 Tax=Marinimicrobium agarilyticum TaxID=306546 RepID=UPI0004805713|nr:ribonuclease E inhibitor RraB [Marinimicrobium agarilyticum]